MYFSPCMNMSVIIVINKIWQWTLKLLGRSLRRNTCFHSLRLSLLRFYYKRDDSHITEEKPTRCHRNQMVRVTSPGTGVDTVRDQEGIVHGLLTQPSKATCKAALSLKCEMSHASGSFPDGTGRPGEDRRTKISLHSWLRKFVLSSSSNLA